MLHQGIRGSQLVVVENAGHAFIWTNPDTLVLHTEQFLAGPRD
jgi:pimeloyl-ACP methyl ester carboxylesterase